MWLTRSRQFLLRAGLAIVLAALVGCSLQVPSDPDGTFDRVNGGVLRVGASPEEPLLHEEDGEVTGSIAVLVEEFAESIDATVEWTIGGEEFLVTQLEAGELDLVVGGLTDATPWMSHAGVTRGYSGIEGAGGRSLVMLVPMGENRFLSELEKFLDEAAA